MSSFKGLTFWPTTMLDQLILAHQLKVIGACTDEEMNTSTASIVGQILIIIWAPCLGLEWRLKAGMASFTPVYIAEHLRQVSSYKANGRNQV